MKILFLGKRFYTNRDSYNERFGRIYQLPYHWAKSGENVSLSLIDYHTPEIAGRTDGPLLISTAPILSSNTLAGFVHEFFNPSRFDVVVASGDCYIGMLGLAIARRNRSLFVFDVYDKYDEFGGYRRLPGFDPFRFLLDQAHLRLFASRALPAIVGERFGSDLVVPNGVDTQKFRSLDRSACRCAFDIPEDILLVGYFGSMEPDRGVDDLITAVYRLRADGINVQAIIGGKHPDERYLNDPAIRYIGNVPFERMPEAIGCADVLTIPYRRSPVMDQGASCKIAEYIACRKPIVTTKTPNFLANFPDQAKQLGDALSEPGNTEDLARAIRVQIARPRTPTFPPEFDWPTIACRTLSKIRERI